MFLTDRFYWGPRAEMARAVRGAHAVVRVGRYIIPVPTRLAHSGTWAWKRREWRRDPRLDSGQVYNVATERRDGSFLVPG